MTPTIKTCSYCAGNPLTYISVKTVTKGSLSREWTLRSVLYCWRCKGTGYIPGETAETVDALYG